MSSLSWLAPRGVPKPRSPNNAYAGLGHRVLNEPVQRLSIAKDGGGALRGSVSLPVLQQRST